MEVHTMSIGRRIELAYYRLERWAWGRTGWHWLPGLTLKVMDWRERKASAR